MSITANIRALERMDDRAERSGATVEYCECRQCKRTVRTTNGRMFCAGCNTQNIDTPRKQPTQAMRRDYVTNPRYRNLFA